MGRHVTAAEDGRLELTMDKHIRVPTDRRSEVRIEGDIESIVLVLGNIQHSSAEVLRTWRSFGQQKLKQMTSRGVLDNLNRSHQGS
jgi:hypothetical protein